MCRAKAHWPRWSPGQGSQYTADPNRSSSHPQVGSAQNYSKITTLTSGSRDGRRIGNVPEVGAHSTSPTIAPVPTCPRQRPLWCRPQCSSPPVQGEGMEGLTARGQVDQRHGTGVRGHHSAGPPGQDRKDGSEESKENRGAQTQGQQPPQYPHPCRKP